MYLVTFHIWLLYIKNGALIYGEVGYKVLHGYNVKIED